VIPPTRRSHDFYKLAFVLCLNAFIIDFSFIGSMVPERTKSEGEELDTLSEWIKNIRKLLKSRIDHLSGKRRTIYPSVFKNTEVVNELRRLHDNFVMVPADKASNNIVFVCKNYYYECLLNQLRFASTSGNPTYTRTKLT
jgi:hypothetical protein